MLSGLSLYKTGGGKGTSPKLVLWNNGHIHAVMNKSFQSAREDPGYRGFVVENGVAAHLLSAMPGIFFELYYWRQGNFEVDYILSTPGGIWVIEVKSSRMKSPKGL